MKLKNLFFIITICAAAISISGCSLIIDEITTAFMNKPSFTIDASSCGDTCVQITINPSSEMIGATDFIEYDVFRNNTAEYSDFTFIGSTTTTSYPDSTVDAGETYYYRVTSVNLVEYKDENGNVVRTDEVNLYFSTWVSFEIPE